MFFAILSYHTTLAVTRHYNYEQNPTIRCALPDSTRDATSSLVWHWHLWDSQTNAARNFRECVRYLVAELFKQSTDKAVNYSGYPIQSVDHPVVIVMLATQDISELKCLYWKVLHFMVCIGMYRNWQPDGSAVQPPLCLRLIWHIPYTPMHINTCKCVQIRTNTD